MITCPDTQTVILHCVCHYRSWLTSLWHDLFNEEPAFYQQPQQVDPKKLLSSLESTENNLRTFFKVKKCTNFITSNIPLATRS